MALIGWLLCIPCAIFSWKMMPYLMPDFVGMCMELDRDVEYDVDDGFVDAAMFLDMNRE